MQLFKFEEKIRWSENKVNTNCQVSIIIILIGIIEMHGIRERYIKTKEIGYYFMAGGICFLFFFEILDKPRVIYYFAWFVNTKSLLPSSVYWI